MNTKQRIAALRAEIRFLETWRCSECGCDLDAANRKRRREGRAEVRRSDKTCSPACRRVRRDAWWSARIERTRSVRISEPNHGPGWHCSECGIDKEKANRRRKRLGMKAVSTASRVCSLECATARNRRRWTARFGRKQLKGGRRGPNQEWL